MAASGAWIPRKRKRRRDSPFVGTPDGTRAISSISLKQQAYLCIRIYTLRGIVWMRPPHTQNYNFFDSLKICYSLQLFLPVRLFSPPPAFQARIFLLWLLERHWRLVWQRIGIHCEHSCSSPICLLEIRTWFLPVSFARASNDNSLVTTRLRYLICFFNSISRANEFRMWNRRLCMRYYSFRNVSNPSRYSVRICVCAIRLIGWT